MLDSPVFLAKKTDSNVVALPGAKVDSQVWVMTNALNNAAGFVSFRSSRSTDQYLCLWTTSGYNVNVTSGGSTTFKNAASFAIAHHNVYDTLDSFSDPIRTTGISLKAYSNSSYAIQCTTTTQCAGVIITTFARTFVFVPSAPNTRINTQIVVADSVITHPLNELVSFSAYSQNHLYLSHGADNKAHVQFPVYQYQYSNSTFRIVAGLNGVAGHYSFRSIKNPLHYLFINASGLAATEPSVYDALFGVPDAVADASFSLIEGLSNSSIAIGYVTVRNAGDPKAYMSWSLSANRENPVVFNTFFNISAAITNLQRMTYSFYLAKGLDSIHEVRSFGHGLKSVKTAAKYIGHDGTSLLLSNSIDVTVIEAVPQLNPSETLGWDSRALVSLRVRLSSSLAPRYLYISRETDGSRPIKLAVDPSASLFPDDFVFVAIPSTSVLYPSGIRFASVLNSTLFLTDVGSNVLQMRVASSSNAATLEATTFMVSTPHRANLIGMNSRVTPCLLCKEGTFASSVASYACLDSPVGSFALLGAIAAVPCVAGTFQDSSKNALCDPCPLGKFQDSDGASSCTNCLAGSFTGVTGLAECEECPIGSYADLAGVSACLPCDAGYISAETGATECVVCPAGKFAAEGSGVCTSCPVGTFSGAAAGECVACSAGTFADEVGKTACQDCLSGHQCPYASMSVPIICANNTASGIPLGAIACNQCDFQSNYAIGEGNSVCTPCDPDVENIYARAFCYDSGRSVPSGNSLTYIIVIVCVSAFAFLLFLAYVKSKVASNYSRV
jgi:hypothetical protein